MRSLFIEQALSVTMYTCISVYMYSLTHHCHACFKHRLIRQNQDSKSIGFIRFGLVYTAKVLNMYLGLFYTTFHERLGYIGLIRRFSYSTNRIDGNFLHILATYSRLDVCGIILSTSQHGTGKGLYHCLTRKEVDTALRTSMC